MQASKAEIDFSKFKPLRAYQWPRFSKEPAVTISKSIIYFNTAFRRSNDDLKQVLISYFDEQLLLTFTKSTKKVAGYKRLSLSGPSSMCTSFASQADDLRKYTHALDLNNFRYTFVLNFVDDMHALVDLNSPIKQKQA